MGRLSQQIDDENRKVCTVNCSFHAPQAIAFEAIESSAQRSTTRLDSTRLDDVRFVRARAPSTSLWHVMCVQRSRSNGNH